MPRSSFLLVRTAALVLLASQTPAGWGASPLGAAEAPKVPPKAASPTSSAATGAAPAAGLTFPQPRHDFGAVIGEQELTHRFKVSNTGTTPVTITAARASCGCTATVVGKSLLGPGESGEIEAAFNTKGQHGKVAKTIEVSSDDPAHPQQTLTLEAEITPEVFVDPLEVRFEDVSGRAARVARVRVRSGRNEELRVTEVTIQGGDFLTASYGQDGVDGVVELGFDPMRVTGGQLAGRALVQVATSSAKGSKVDLFVRWTLKQAIAIQPVGFHWNELAGQAYQGHVTLRLLAAGRFSILSAKTSHPEFQVTVALNQPGTVQEAAVLVSKTLKPGQYEETITFTTDDPDQPLVVVPMKVLLREAGESPTAGPA